MFGLFVCFYCFIHPRDDDVYVDSCKMLHIIRLGCVTGNVPIAAFIECSLIQNR